ncbi:MAG: hypothetical protein R3F43_27755 [bacterium]
MGAALGVGLPMVLERLLRKLGQATLAHRGRCCWRWAAWRCTP